MKLSKQSETEQDAHQTKGTFSHPTALLCSSSPISNATLITFSNGDIGMSTS